MRKIIISTFAITILALAGCGSDKSKNNNSENNPEIKKETKTDSDTSDPMKNKGIGPVSHVELPSEIDQTMAERGAEIYKTKCSACHKPDKRFVGPAPLGILERRSPEWVMNMILNPEVMVQQDPIAKALLAEYLSPMANQNLTEEEARAVLEYFRTLK